MPDFKLGDKVKLNSGSPELLVEYIRVDGLLRCSWFDGTEKKVDYFHPNMVKKI